MGGPDALSILLELDDRTNGSARTPADRSAVDKATLEAARRLMPDIDGDLIARAMELGPHRPGENSSD
jgi:hypothetical protein